MTKEAEEEAGMDPKDIVRVIKTMPDTVNIVGMAELFANLLEAYDMKGVKARDVIMLTAMMSAGKAEMKLTRVHEEEIGGRVN